MCFGNKFNSGYLFKYRAQLVCYGMMRCGVLSYLDLMKLLDRLCQLLQRYTDEKESPVQTSLNALQINCYC
jgi:hypothetical protein